MPPNPIEARPDDPTFAALYDRRVAQEREALAELDEAWPWKDANEIKAWLAQEAGKLNVSLEAMSGLAAGGLDPEQVRALRQHLVDTAAGRLDQYRQRIRKRFGARTTVPDFPVKGEDDRRFHRILARLHLVYDRDDRTEYHEALRDAIAEEARAGRVTVVRLLGDLVDRELKAHRFDEFHEQHPMREAQVALELAQTSKDTVLAELAEDRLERIQNEIVNVVGRTILEEGTWSGPRARSVFGPHSDDFRVLDPVGADETAARGTPEEARRARALQALPTEDPLAAMADLSERLEDAGIQAPAKPEGADPEAAMRDRIQTNEEAYRAAHGLGEG